MKKNHGFILLTVLLFLQIFVLITTSVLQDLMKQQRLNEQLLSIQLQFQRTMTQLSILSERLQSIKQICLLSNMLPQRWREVDTSWLQANTCSANSSEIRYYYAVEALGVDPCSMIQQEKGQLQAEFYRLTIYSITAANAKIILQSTLALPTQVATRCEQTPHVVQPGRQMWREI